jgi:hypothetical protein
VTVAARPALMLEWHFTLRLRRCPCRCPCRAIRRLGEAHALYAPAADKLIAPFRPRSSFTPMPRRAHLARLGREFRALPSFGRLRILIKCDAAGLQIAEVRAIPSRISLPDWGDSEREPGISIVLKAIGIAPPRFGETDAVTSAPGAMTRECCAI